MPTNSQLLDEYKQRKQLAADRKVLAAEIRKATRQLEALDDRLRNISNVTHVLKGVCLDVFKYENGHWKSARTVADRRKGPLRVELYERVNTKCWAVTLNEGYAFEARFHGCGKTIGLRHSWTYAQALAKAKRWLLGDESVLADY
jgi:hypothetical protein